MPTETYLHLPPGGALSEWAGPQPFKAVVVVEADVEPEWRDAISDWLVRSGSLYMIAWGADYSAWDDAVDYAALKMFDFGAIPDESFVMTTWHENEPLEEAFWYSQFIASFSYNDQELNLTLILDIGPAERRVEMLALFEVSKDLHNRPD